jgi:hypothetical protein
MAGHGPGTGAVSWFCHAGAAAAHCTSKQTAASHGMLPRKTIDEKQNDFGVEAPGRMPGPRGAGILPDACD